MFFCVVDYKNNKVKFYKILDYFRFIFENVKFIGFLFEGLFFFFFNIIRNFL